MVDIYSWVLLKQLATVGHHLVWMRLKIHVDWHQAPSKIERSSWRNKKLSYVIIKGTSWKFEQERTEGTKDIPDSHRFKLKVLQNLFLSWTSLLPHNIVRGWSIYNICLIDTCFFAQTCGTPNHWRPKKQTWMFWDASIFGTSKNIQKWVLHSTAT
jgi:hypothetical protein